MIAPSASGRPNVIIGQFPADLGEEIHQQICRVKARDPLAGIILIVPSETAVAYTERELALADVNLANVRIVTLSRFPYFLNSIATSKSLPALPSGSESALLYSALREALQTDNPFGDSVDFPGFGRSAARALTDLIQAKIDYIGASVYAGLRTKIGERLRAIDLVLKHFKSSFAPSFKTVFDNFEVDPLILLKLKDLLNVEEIVFYGIYDFNEQQYRFLKTVIESFPTTLFVPASTSHGSISEAFKFSQSTVDRVVADYPESSVAYIESKDQFSLSLFDYASPETTPQVPNFDLHIFSSMHLAAESEIIVGQIADLVFNRGVAADRIGVVLWQPEMYQDLFREDFRRAALPIYDGIGRSLSKTPAGRALTGLLSLSAESISGRAILDCLQNEAQRHPKSEDEGSFVLVEQIINSSGVIKGGAAAWEKALNQSATLYEGEKQNLRMKVCADNLRDFILQLFVRLDQIQAKNTLSETAKAIIGLTSEFLNESEDKARIIEQLGGLNALSDERFLFEYGDVLQIVNASLGAVVVGRGAPLEDGVALLTPLTARNVKFDYLFLPGFSQGRVPAVSRDNPLLPEEVRRRINRALTGKEEIPLPLASGRIAEEKMLFGLLVSSAEKRVVVSYPTRSFGDATVEFPSQFLLEACRVATGRSIAADNLPEVDFYDDFTAGDFTAGWENRLVRPVDYYLKLASSFPSNSNVKLLGEMRAGDAEFINRLRESYSLRGSGNRWTNFDGMPGAEGAVRDGEALAVTELEDYAECPFRCWLTRRLKLKEWRDPEVSLDIPPEIVGQMIHEIYDKLFRLALTTGRIPLTSEEIQWANEQMPLVMESIRPKYLNKCPAPPGVWSITENALIERVEASLPKLIELQEEYRFTNSEQTVRFAVASSSAEEETGNVELTGRIDRIDRTEDGQGLHVIDYKTGSAGDPSKLKSGSRLQLPLYLKTLSSSHPQINPTHGKASYWQIGRNGNVKTYSVDGEWLATNAVTLEEIVQIIVSGLVAGWFPPLPIKEEICRNCSVEKVCDYRSRFAADYRLDDERMGSLLKIREKD